MKRRFLELIMTVLMFGALYVTVRHSVSSNGELVILEEDRITVVIDCGHGGIDSGKVANDGTLEKDINLSIGNILKEKLEASGYQVFMTRTDDSGLYNENDTNKKASDMKKRCSFIEEKDADILVSIHQNSYTTAAPRGAQMFYYKNSKEGEKLALSLTEAFREVVSDEYTREAKSNNTYYMLLKTKCPAVIAECGFLSNYEEAELLKSAEYQEKIADAILLGIQSYVAS